MFKGTNASAGIGIGKAAIIKENELVIRPEKVIDGAAEVERFKGALAETIAQTETLAAGFPRGREGSRDHAGTPDAVK